MRPTVRVSWGLALLFCGSFTASPGMAAEPAFVSKLGGYDVTIQRGGEAIPVRVQMLLSAGETVRAGPDSFVEVRYLSDGCTLRVANGRSIAVAGSSPCAAAEEQEKAKAEEPPAKPSKVSAKAAPKEDVVARVTSRSGPLARANFGNGLVELQTGTELKAGHTLFAGQGSSITIYYYKPDCEYTIAEESYLEIREEAPCKKATTAAGSADAGLAIGATLLLGGGAAAAFMLLQGEEDDRPVTPN